MEKDVLTTNNQRKSTKDETMKGQVDFTMNQQQKDLFKN